MPRSLLITGIGELVTNAPDGPPADGQPTTSAARSTGDVPSVRRAGAGGFAALADAALVIEDGLIVWTGPAARAPAADEAADVAGRAVLPGFVDSHAHLVFAGDRSAEFAARMAGRPYQAGGIRTTVAATRDRK